MEELIARTFALRNSAQLAHWATRNYARHKATGAVYGALIERLDSIVEMFQGAFYPIGEVMSLPHTASDFENQLRGFIDWVETHRKEISKENPTLENELLAFTGELDGYLYQVRMLS